MLSFCQKKNYKLNFLLVFLLLEILSWLSFNFIPLAGIVLALIAALTLYLLIKNPVFYLYISLAELFWGSMGHSFDYGIFSLRLLIFLLVFFVWLVRAIVAKHLLDFKNKIFLLWLFILFLVFAAIVNAYLSGHVIADIFIDANAYFYLLYLPIWWQVYERKYLKNILAILLSAAIITTLKTFWLFHIFSQDYALDMNMVYKWVRDTRTGEITPLADNLYRVFMQSQVYVLIAWIVLFYEQIKEKKYHANFAILTLFSTALLLSMSRSFWLGLVVAAVVVLAVLYKKINWKLIFNFIFIILGSLLLIQVLFNLPNFNNFLGVSQQRLDSGGAAVSSRQQLLQPMLDEIKNRPILGHGFGKKITYNTDDPRIKNEANPSGLHTTFSFEWGWLEQYIKLGIFFVLSFVICLIMFYNKIYRLAVQNSKKYYIIAAILSAFVVIHIFSPYLNHPLGLGTIMLISIILYKNEKTADSHS